MGVVEHVDAGESVVEIFAAGAGDPSGVPRFFSGGVLLDGVTTITADLRLFIRKLFLKDRNGRDLRLANLLFVAFRAPRHRRHK